MPAAISRLRLIDIATLTGACVVASGRTHTGVMGNDDKLAQELVTLAGARTIVLAAAAHARVRRAAQDQLR